MKLGKALHIVRGVLDHDTTIDFYKTLGYTELETGDKPTKFTLFTDGRVNLLISQDQMTYTGLIYFDDDQTQRVKKLEETGISFFWKQEDEESGKIKQAMFEVIPEKFGINLVSASYNEKSIPKGESTIPIGMFSELAIPVDDYDAITSKLELLGFKQFGKNTEPYNWGIVHDGLIPLGLHQTSDFDMNIPTYFTATAQDVLADLKEKGLNNELMDENNGTVIAPDGQRIFVFHATNEQLEMMKNFTG